MGIGRTCLNLDQLCQGMRVVLTHPDPEYILDGSNPVIGGEYFCVGTVDAVYGEEAEVQWDNEHMNVYKDGELSEWGEEHRRYVSIWDEI